MIFVKVNEEDFGKVMTCDINKLPNPIIDFNHPCVEYRIHPNPLDKVLYLGIYCHFDGYPSGVGEELKTKFNTYEKALNLILLGACSSIITDIRAYHNWRNEDLEIKSVQGVYPTIGDGIDYMYVFENGEWK
jgi:hypothetical protein